MIIQPITNESMFRMWENNLVPAKILKVDEKIMRG